MDNSIKLGHKGPREITIIIPGPPYTVGKPAIEQRADGAWVITYVESPTVDGILERSHDYE